MPIDYNIEYSKLVTYIIMLYEGENRLSRINYHTPAVRQTEGKQCNVTS